MKTIATLAIAALLASAMPVRAQETRPTDPDVKALIQRVWDSRERFEDALDGKLKSSIIRGDTGEVDVNRYLDDLEQNINNLKDRFTDDYAASSEALTVLRQCTGLNRFVMSQPATFRGRSEWDAMAADLGNLARTYNVPFPVPEGVTARRMNDKEVAAAADALAKASDRFKNATKDTLKKAKAAPEAVNAIEADGKALTEAAKTLKSRLSDHKPASNEMRILLEKADKLTTYVKATPPAPGVAEAAWKEVAANLEKIRQAFPTP